MNESKHEKVANEIKTIYGINKLHFTSNNEKQYVESFFPNDMLWLVSQDSVASLYVCYKQLKDTRIYFIVIDRNTDENLVTTDYSLARSKFKILRKKPSKDIAASSVLPASKLEVLTDFLYCLKAECNDTNVIEEVENAMMSYVKGTSYYNYISETDIISRGFGSIKNLAELAGIEYKQLKNCVSRNKISPKFMPAVWPLLHELN